MEKISRIIPANARTQSAEVAAAQPARPGSPAFGRPMGRVTKTPVFVEDRLTISAGKPQVPAVPGTYGNTKPEIARAKVVEDLAKKFFDTSNPKTEVRDNDMTKSEEALKTVDNLEPIAPVKAAPEKLEQPKESLAAY
jgi:hypothetical protein